MKPGSFVGVMLERSIDMIVAILATLKAGAAYLPLDSDYPQARLDQILTDAMPTVVLSNARLRSRLPETVKVLELDAQETEIRLRLAPAENPTNSERSDALLPNNPAYLIYTSGSTGTPKGVVIEHAALSFYSRTVAAHYELSSTDRVLQFASLSFDAAVEEIFPTLIAGASLVMRDSEIWTSWECRQRIRELGVTVINLPTAYWEQLVQDWANEEDDLSIDVRLILVGGEALRPSVSSSGSGLLCVLHDCSTPMVPRRRRSLPPHSRSRQAHILPPECLSANHCQVVWPIFLMLTWNRFPWECRESSIWVGNVWHAVISTGRN